MAVRQVSVMAGFLLFASLVVLGGGQMVLGSLLMVFGCVTVVFGGFRHGCPHFP
jgi:hypothetical protein